MDNLSGTFVKVGLKGGGHFYENRYQSLEVICSHVGVVEIRFRWLKYLFPSEALPR
jgi:hypothetical protein